MKRAGRIETIVTTAMYVKPQLKPYHSMMYPNIMLEIEASVNPMVK